MFITVMWYMTRKGEDMKRPILDISIKTFFLKLSYVCKYMKEERLLVVFQ